MHHRTSSYFFRKPVMENNIDIFKSGKFAPLFRFYKGALLPLWQNILPWPFTMQNSVLCQEIASIDAIIPVILF